MNNLHILAMPFLEGYAIGLGMIIFVGPVFFLLLNSSFQSGSKAGIAVALGIIVSDIVCVTLCYYGFSSLTRIDDNQFWIGLIGSSIVFLLGISYIFKKPKLISETSINFKGLHVFFIKGFSVNFFNPFVFVVWMGVFNYGKSTYPTPRLLLIFLGAVLFGILTIDLLKVFLSRKVKRFISTQRLAIFFKITGVILILFSFRILYSIW